MWQVEILNVEPLKTSEAGWDVGGRVGSGGGPLCASDLDSCQSLPLQAKEKEHVEGRFLGVGSLW